MSLFQAPGKPFMGVVSRGPLWTTQRGGVVVPLRPDSLSPRLSCSAFGVTLGHVFDLWAAGSPPLGDRSFLGLLGKCARVKDTNNR